MSEQNEPLSERELEILRLVATGAANKEIARQLEISPNTVKVHLRNIFVKIGVASRTEATLYAIQLGLVKPGAAGELVEISEEDQLAGETAAGEPNGREVTTLGNVAVFDAASAQIEGQSLAPLSSDLPVSQPRRTRLAFWQIVLGAALALTLIITGVFGGRLMASPSVTPAVAAQETQAALSRRRWSALADLPAPRMNMGMAEYENAFYLLGGETASGVDGVTLRYLPATNRWETLTSKPTPVSEIQAALLGEKIYIPGGRLANGKTTDQLEVYNPRHDSWESKAPLPVSLSAYALATFEGRIYLFGGKHDNQYVNQVFVYDPQEDRWEERSPMRSPRAFAMAVTTGAKIQVIGGYDGRSALTTNEAYLPTRDASGETAWEVLAPLPSGRYGMGAAHLAGMIFVLGGAGEKGESGHSSMLYQIQTNQWSEFETPPASVGANLALIASGNRLYLFGGKAAGGMVASSHAYQAIFTIAVPAVSNDR